MPAGAPEGTRPPEASESPTAPQPQPPAHAAQDGMELPPGFGVAPSGPPQAPIVEAPGPGQGPTLLPLAPGGSSTLRRHRLPRPTMPPRLTEPDQQGAVQPQAPACSRRRWRRPRRRQRTPLPPPAVPETETGSIALPAGAGRRIGRGIAIWSVAEGGRRRTASRSRSMRGHRAMRWPAGRSAAAHRHPDHGARPAR